MSRVFVWYGRISADWRITALPTRRRCPGTATMLFCIPPAAELPSHHKQRKKGQPLRPLRPFYGTKGPCRFDGCPKPRVSGGYCAGHAAQYCSRSPSRPSFPTQVGLRFSWLHEAPLRARLLPGVTGASYGRSVRSHRSVRSAGGVWTRATSPSWQRNSSAPYNRSRNCTHKNGIRHDNRPENLELWARGMQPPGSRVSDLIDFAHQSPKAL